MIDWKYILGKARPQTCKNPDGYIWRSTNTKAGAHIGFLPTEICARLKPTMPNPEHSPTGLWYKTPGEALEDLKRIHEEMTKDAAEEQPANIQKKRRMTREEHKARHVILHQHLDELLADYVHITGLPVGSKTVEELMAWSYAQTIYPTELE